MNLLIDAARITNTSMTDRRTLLTHCRMARDGHKRRLARRTTQSVAFLLSLLAIADARADSPSAAASAPCSEYTVIGVRGSGESYSGWMGMGSFGVSAYAQAASRVLPFSTWYHSLQYPAALPAPGHQWFSSVRQGEQILLNTLRARLQHCPFTVFGLIGYSQGAYVVHNVLNMVEFETRKAIGSVLLLSDPASAGVNAPYTYGVALYPGYDARRTGGGILKRALLDPHDWGRVMDVCIAGDPVCDAPQGDWFWEDLLIDALVTALGFDTHLAYGSCCAGFPGAILFYGQEFAMRILRARPAPPSGVPQPPPPPNPQPAPAPVTSVYGLPDGTLLRATDTGRIYKMVGGAPIWQATCDDGICSTEVRPTTQAVINAGPATPRNGSSAIDQRGRIYIFVGGAPLWQSSCASPVNCGVPVKISDWSIDARDHMYRVPTDRNLIQGWTGSTPTAVAQTVGGARINFATPQEVIDTGYGSNWPSAVVIISTWSFNNLSTVPVDRTLVQGTTGGVSTPVAQLIGGVRINFASAQELIDTGFGTSWASRVRAIPTRAFNEMRADVPPDGTLVQGAGATSTPVAVIVGRARVNFASPQEVIDSGYGTDWASKVRAIPTRAFNFTTASIANGTWIANASTDAQAVTAGGGAIPFTSSDDLSRTHHGNQPLRRIPARVWNDLTKRDRRLFDGTLLVMVDRDNFMYRMEAGEGSLAGDCAFGAHCGAAVAVTWRMVEHLVEVAQTGDDWVDVSGDGKADYCRRVGSGGSDQRVACTLSTGYGMGATIISAPLDWGHPSGRAWADVTGDGKADFCRVRGTRNGVDSMISCSPSTGSGFGPDMNSIGVFDWGYATGRAWVDANADGKADYCRRVGNGGADQRVACTLSSGGSFSQSFASGPLDWGHASGRAWVDISGDRRADFCRVRGTRNGTDALISCSPSTGTGFGGDVNSIGSFDWGYASSRDWVDVNADGKADYCRRVGNGGADQRIACTLSSGGIFTQSFASGPIDWGYPLGRAWVDITGDGKADFCRVRGSRNFDDALISCSPSTGSGFAGDVNSVDGFDWGFLTRRRWADATGDGKVDYCRRVGIAGQHQRVSCTVSSGEIFTTTFESTWVDWGIVE